jgi:hypothetical protein
MDISNTSFLEKEKQRNRNAIVIIINIYRF